MPFNWACIKSKAYQGAQYAFLSSDQDRTSQGVLAAISVKVIEFPVEILARGPRIKPQLVEDVLTSIQDHLDWSAWDAQRTKQSTTLSIQNQEKTLQTIKVETDFLQEVKALIAARDAHSQLITWNVALEHGKITVQLDHIK